LTSEGIALDEMPPILLSKAIDEAKKAMKPGTTAVLPPFEAMILECTGLVHFGKGHLYITDGVLFKVVPFTSAYF